MDNEVFERAFESGESNKKSLRVFVINPPGENPWRTRDEYQHEQAEARERHAMFQEQHRMLQEQHRLFQEQQQLMAENVRLVSKNVRVNVCLAVATFLGAIASAALVIFTIVAKTS